MFQKTDDGCHSSKPLVYCSHTGPLLYIPGTLHGPCVKMLNLFSIHISFKSHAIPGCWIIWFPQDDTVSNRQNLNLNPGLLTLSSPRVKKNSLQINTTWLRFLMENASAAILKLEVFSWFSLWWTGQVRWCGVHMCKHCVSGDCSGSSLRGQLAGMLAQWVQINPQ